MGMFDYYRPVTQQHCPVCLRPLNEWQGTEGCNGLFVWGEGSAAPLTQEVDEEVCIDASRRDTLRLPDRFSIYSYDCPEHQPIEADCETREGVWSETKIRPYSPRRGRG